MLMREKPFIDSKPLCPSLPDDPKPTPMPWQKFYDKYEERFPRAFSALYATEEFVRNRDNQIIMLAVGVPTISAAVSYFGALYANSGLSHITEAWAWSSAPTSVILAPIITAETAGFIIKKLTKKPGKRLKTFCAAYAVGLCSSALLSAALATSLCGAVSAGCEPTEVVPQKEVLGRLTARLDDPNNLAATIGRNETISKLTELEASKVLFDITHGGYRFSTTGDAEDDTKTLTNETVTRLAVRTTQQKGPRS